MPSSKIVPVKHGGVEKVLKYLADQSAESHPEYHLTPLRVMGADNPTDFIRLCEKGRQIHMDRHMKGRPSEISAYWYIVRFPDGSRLRPSERRLCRQKIIGEARAVGHEPTIDNEHRNLIFASQDFNVLKPSFNELGIPNRGSLLHPIRELRARMDEAVTIINAHRDASDRFSIPEMKLIRKERARAKFPDIVEKLGKLPKPPGNKDELLAAFWSLGWDVTVVGKRKKLFLVSDDKKTWKREIDVDGILGLVVRWRLSQFMRIKSIKPLAGLENIS